MASWPSLDLGATKLMENCESMSVAGALIGVLKVVVSATTGVLACAGMVPANIPTHMLAGNHTWRGLATVRAHAGLEEQCEASGAGGHRAAADEVATVTDEQAPTSAHMKRASDELNSTSAGTARSRTGASANACVCCSVRIPLPALPAARVVPHHDPASEIRVGEVGSSQIEDALENGLESAECAPAPTSAAPGSDVKSRDDAAENTPGSEEDKVAPTLENAGAESPPLQAQDKRAFTPAQVAAWLATTINASGEVQAAVLEELVDGTTMDRAVSNADREALVELGITKRLQQAKVFAKWAEM